ncbi:MAG: FAD-binding protein [Acidimicrobiaceae bacterium]|nr:FAD-binding protein [Acidimicrobiaceae bacterium]
MRIAVLVKQIPAPVEFRMQDGRLVRDGVPLEVNAYCRRANAKAVELAGPDGEVVVFTMGPPAAADALREMIACGAHRGVHLCDPALAGADTLATAVALAAAIRHQGPFDLVLAGLNSLDSDTGQVPVEVAELLDLPFAAGVRELDVTGGAFTAKLETDDGYYTVTGDLPAALSTAERLCAPSKAPPEEYAAVADDRILRLTAADLDVPPEQLGAPGSPTSVGPIRVLTASRRALRATSVGHAVDLLEELGAFSDPPESDDTGEEEASRASAALLAVDGDGQHPAGERSVWCFFTEPGVGAELLGEAAELAAWISGTVTAVTTTANAANTSGLGAAGADRLLVIESATEPSEQAAALAAAAARSLPWALLVEGTRSGRVVASIVAARCGWGLTGDAVGLEVSPDGRLVAWKPAFGGRLQVPILSRSPVQMATIRPGVLALRPPRADAAELEAELLPAPPPARIRTVAVERDDADTGELRRARTVVAVGVGVQPDGYPVIDELRAALGDAALGATRRVTDQGWVPRGRQIGVTGHAVSPRLLVAVGSSGRFNHTVGIRNAGVLMAVNSDPDAEIFDQVDIGLIGEWQTIVPKLTAELNKRGIADRIRSSDAPTEGTATTRREMRVSDLRASRAKPVRASGHP